MEKISIEDKKYPELLRKIKNPPKVLYYEGKIEPKEMCLAIVGTRRFSSYGKQTALEIAGDIADYGLTIVSGLAPGIDTFAHLAAVERKKRTIAVLGTGLDEKSIYPKENINLARKIVELGGCLISEYPPGTRGSKITFPQRNRIVSGLSLGVFVVEAKIRSGSLITAREALSQNRKVFALPGSIYSLNSQGTNSLIKKGAKLVETAEDILQELNLPAEALPCQQAGLPLKNYIGSLAPEEKLIIEALAEEALHIDKIIEKTKLSAADAAGALTVLEIKNRVRNLGGNIYALKR